MKPIQSTLAAIALLVSFSLASCDQSSGPKTEFLTIGTGGLTGVYYPTGSAIAKLVNQKSAEYNFKTTAESTGGSVYNINAVLSGDLQFGVAQSDKGYQAWKGEKDWKANGPQTELRSLFSIHPEVITLVAAVNSKINGVADLKGKRVNLGNPGSGQLGNSKDALTAFGVNLKDVNAEHVKALEAPSLLQDERIDAFFYTLGHPAGNIKEATSGRVKVKIIDIQGPEVDALLASTPYYAKAKISIANYPNAANKKDVESFGVKATLISSTETSKEAAYAITKEVFENLDTFKTLHPAFANLTAEGMLEGLTAPIHEGAMQYYIESGLDKKLPAHLQAQTK